MMYRVLTDFSDMLDNGHVYRTGDTYPRLGVSVSEHRIRELASSSNRLGEPMIEVVSEDRVEDETETVKTVQEAVETVQIKPKRRRKKD